MLKTLLVRKLVAVAFSVMVTSVVPFVLQDKPRLEWAWDKAGPRIVDMARDRVDSRIDIVLDGEKD